MEKGTTEDEMAGWQSLENIKSRAMKATGCTTIAEIVLIDVIRILMNTVKLTLG